MNDVDDERARDKSVAGNSAWDNYLLQGDVKMNSSGENTNAGMLLRVTNPETGTDDFDGYGAYVNIEGSLVVGRHNSDNTWTYLTDDAIPDGVSVSSWYRVFFYLDGCDGRAVAQPVTSYEQADLSFSDTSCHSAGGIGVRTFNADSSWRYLSVSPY